MSIVHSLQELDINQAHFPIFFSDEWLEKEKTHGQVFIWHNKSLDCVIPYKTYKSKFLTLGYYIYSPLTLAGKEVENEEICLNAFHTFIKQNSICDVLFPPQHVCFFKSIPENSYYYSLGLISLDLQQSEEDLLAKMKSSFRRQIRKAERDEVTMQTNALDDFYEAYVDTHKKQNLLCQPKTYFQDLYVAFPDNTLVSSSRYNGNLESGIFVQYDAQKGYYLYGGSSKKLLHQGSNKYMFWKVILYLKKKGCSEFNLGGYREETKANDKHSGIQEFKLGLGAEIKQGYHFYKVFSPTKFFIFSTVNNILKAFSKVDRFPINKNGLNIQKS